MESQIEYRVGSISFACKGEAAWVVDQGRGFLKDLPKLIELGAATSAEDTDKKDRLDRSDSKKQSGSGQSVTLAKYLTDRNANDQPAKRFLATSQWLHDKGKDRVAMRDVTTAITQAKQKKFSNPSTFLSTNIRNGHIEGDAKDFFVTHEGRAELGISE